MASPVPSHVNDVDWPHWKAREEAVLCFIRRGNELMLIHKKTGLGKGKINAPGGRIEPGETPEQAAVREVKEEIHLTPDDLREVGQLFFIFTDGYTLHGTVFFAESYCGGDPVETPEAAPFWCPVDAIPYDDMWEDDRHWLPLVLDGKYVKGYFIFDDDRMLSKRIDVGP